MQGDARVIDYLNRGLRSELTAINQYWLLTAFSIIGLQGLAKKWREDPSRNAHADKFTTRFFSSKVFPTCRS